MTYTESKSLCDGNLTTVNSTRTCTIASAAFTAPPYSLSWGSSIYAKVSATNSKGTSVISQGGNGAIIWTNPDAPISVANDPSVTTGYQIGLTWLPGIADGGTPVIDYRIYWDNALMTYEILDSGIKTLNAKVINLTPGLTYRFKI